MGEDEGQWAQAEAGAQWGDEATADPWGSDAGGWSGESAPAGQVDGGLPPGGLPEWQPCDCGPCPACSEDRQVSSPCALQLGHADDHRCAAGDVWVQADPSATPLRRQCTATCQYCGAQCRKDLLHAVPHWCGKHDF